MAITIYRPQWPERRIIFGDGLQAQLLHSQEGKKDSEDAEQIIFWFVPLPHLRWTYSIQDEEYTSRTEWYIKRKYPKDKCKLLNASPFTTTWLVYLTYDGHEGLSIEQINKENELRAQEYKKSYFLLTKFIARRYQEFKKLLNQPDVVRDSALQDLKKTLVAAGVKMEQPASQEQLPGEEMG